MNNPRLFAEIDAVGLGSKSFLVRMDRVLAIAKSGTEDKTSYKITFDTGYELTVMGSEYRSGFYRKFYNLKKEEV